MSDGGLLKCPMGCPCMFVCQEDLDSHLKAFEVKPAPVNVSAQNPEDHKLRWDRELFLRDREFINNG